jgi:hypothetical protein
MDGLSIEIDWTGLLLTLGGIAVGAIIVGMAVSAIRRAFRGHAFGTDRESLRRRWAEIESLVEQPGMLTKKMALLEADKLLDLALKSLAMPGETLGERLKYAAYKFPEVRDVWWAHKLRNQMAHEATFEIDNFTAKRAIGQFKKTLQRLGAI